MPRFGFLIISLVFLALRLDGQTVERQKLVAAYTYSFAKNIKWEAKKDSYNLWVLTRDDKLIEEFRFLSDTRQLNGKPIKVAFSTTPIVPQDTDIVFIDTEFNLTVRAVFNQIAGEEILLITDGYTNERFIMINFIERDPSSLSFNINRANIINQGLGILPDMLLLGGDEVDVAKLYRQAQDSLQAMESRILSLQDRFDAISEDVNTANNQISKQAEIIKDQNIDIDAKQKFLSDQERILDSLMNQFGTSERMLDSMNNYLSNLRGELIKVENELQDQRENVQRGEEILEAQSVLVDQREREIINRESQLQEMETVVLSQKNLLFLLVTISGIMILFSVVTYRAYTARRRDAMKLAKQKEELSELLTELRSAQSQLVQSEKMASLGVLIAGIAHEINNAINFVYSGIHIIKAKFTELNPIIAQVKKLKGDDKDLKKKVDELVDLRKELGYNDTQRVIRDMIKNVQIGAERTTEIVKGLKTFSRSEDEIKSSIDVHEDIDVALLLLEGQYKNIINVEKKFAEKVPTIEGYQGQLGQAFLNLIGNAIDAVQEKGEKAKITIRTKLKKGFVEISIKDNGMGISPEVLDKIFDPFFTTKGIGIGTGLGLSITYGIIEKHGGNIQVHSEPGKGAEFIVLLPLPT